MGLAQQAPPFRQTISNNRRGQTRHGLEAGGFFVNRFQPVLQFAKLRDRERQLTPARDCLHDSSDALENLLPLEFERPLLLGHVVPLGEKDDLLNRFRREGVFFDVL